MSLNVAIIIVTIVMVIVGYFIVMSDWWHTLPQRPRTVIFAGAVIIWLSMHGFRMP